MEAEQDELLRLRAEVEDELVRLRAEVEALRAHAQILADRAWMLRSALLQVRVAFEAFQNQTLSFKGHEAHQVWSDLRTTILSGELMCKEEQAS